MKKILFLFPLAVLLAAGCNSSQQTYNQPPIVQNTNPAQTSVPTPSPAPTSTPTSSDWHTYTNSKFGFQLTFTDQWKGYKVQEHINNPVAGDYSIASYGFLMPTPDKELGRFDNGYYNMFSLFVFSKDGWQKEINEDGPKPSLLKESQDYIFALSPSQGYGNDQKLEALSRVMGTVIDSFTLLNSQLSWKTYTNKTYGFIVQIPTDYIVEDSSDQINIMPQSFQKNRRGAMLQISPVNVGRESVFDKGNENLVSCKIIDTTLGGKNTKLCTAKSIYGYSYYSRVTDLTGTKWGKDNEISFSLNLEGEIQSQQELDSILGSYNKIISSLKFNN